MTQLTLGQKLYMTCVKRPVGFLGALAAMMVAIMEDVKNRIYYRHGIIYSTMPVLKQKVFISEEKFVSALAMRIVNVSLR